MRLADLRTDVEDGVVVARIDGELDMSNARTIATAIRGRVANDARGLVVDLTALEFIDSAGIRALFRLREDLSTRSQMIGLVVPSGATIARALEIVNVPGSIPTFETTDAALASIDR